MHEKIEDHPCYLDAADALGSLYQKHGEIQELISIRNFFRLVRNLDIPKPTHPWVGRGSPHDREVVEAYQAAFNDFIRDTSDDYDEPWSD
jgi:hypothetical protein